MTKAIEENFIYGGKKVTVRDLYCDTRSFIKMQVGGRIETIEPKEHGFLTGPKSEISHLFGKKGSFLIPAVCAKMFFDRMKRYRLSRDTVQVKKWLLENGSACAGLLYGTLAPGKKCGWYVVLMMKIGQYGGYIDYMQPGYEFLGEQHNFCEQIRIERGSDDIYHNGAEFFVTIVTNKEVVKLLITRHN
jgi:hypothetical protein